ncbi:hypothetical protein ACFWFQ_28910, partial [Nocardia salmonicida]|uniref:hypothetical protein n=1 Tax=Nocardia salmonicida TaxID=53431 RepID=UPI003669C8EC
MNIITTVLGAAAIGLSAIGMTPIASATPMAPHETTYHGPAGFELTPLALPEGHPFGPHTLPYG